MSSGFDIFDSPIPIPTPAIGGLPSSAPAIPTFSGGPVIETGSSLPATISSTPFLSGSTSSPGFDTSSSFVPAATSSSGFPTFTMSSGASSVPGAGMNSNGQPYGTGEVTMGSGGGSVMGGNGHHATRSSTAGAPGEIRTVGTSGVLITLLLWLAAFVA